MNKLRTSFFFFILLAINVLAFSQTEGLKRTVLGGKEFYMYEVKQGESLYKISKTFNIPQEEIIQYNQEAISGVKSGMTLKIPVTSARKSAKSAPAKAESHATEAKEKGVELTATHKIEKGQTLYSICKQYQVDKATLLKLNPSLANGVKVGEEIKIPVKKGKAKTKIEATESASKEAPAKTEVIDHVVTAKETLFSISRKYNVNVTEIKKSNQAELENGLKVGQHLKIPIKKGIKSSTPAEKKAGAVKNGKGTEVAKAETHKVASKPAISNEVTAKAEKKATAVQAEAKEATTAPLHTAAVAKHESAAPASETRKHDDPMVHVTLLLPFMLNETDKQDATINKFVEFYEGFLLGINKMKEEGISVELSTFDIEKSDTKVKEVLQSNPSIKRSDLIVGPAYTSQVKAVAEYAKANNIPTLVPFSSKIEALGTNPYLFQNNCPQQKQFAGASKLFLKKFADKNIVIIHFNNDINDEGSEFSRHLVASLKRQKIAFHDVLFTQENFANLHKVISTGKETILILGTDKAMLIRELLPKISQLNSANTPISIVGFPAWEKELKTYPSTYFFSQFFVNKNSKDNALYKEKFRQEFGFTSTASPRFDLMGYDLSTFFIKALSANGKNYTQIPMAKQEHAMQSKFHFQKVGVNGGYVNDGLLLIHYAPNKELEIIE